MCIRDSTGTVYRLGDRLRVQVAAVNLDDRKIDFVLAEPQAKRKAPSRTQDNAPGRTQGKPAATAPEKQEPLSEDRPPRPRSRRKRRPGDTKGNAE